MSAWWERVAKFPEEKDAPKPQDREGRSRHYAFQDCLEEHKNHVLYGIWAVVVPWSAYVKDLKPLIFGTIVAILPETLYPSYRCNEQYQMFKQHVEEVKQQMNQDRSDAEQAAALAAALAEAKLVQKQKRSWWF